MAMVETILSVFLSFNKLRCRKMKFLPPGYNTKYIEKLSKNKWRWERLSELDTLGSNWVIDFVNLMSLVLRFVSVVIK